MASPPPPPIGSYFEDGSRLLRLEAWGPEAVVVQDAVTEVVEAMSFLDFARLGARRVDYTPRCPECDARLRVSRIGYDCLRCGVSI